MIARGSPGGTIHLGSGYYPQLVSVSANPGWVTISGSGDPSPPVIDGAVLAGARHLRFVDVKFDRSVFISHNPSNRVPASHLQILNSEIDCGSTTASRPTFGLMVRAGARDVVVRGDYIHNCVVGFASVAQDPVSKGITISHNTFQDFPGDAIDLGGLSGVVIDHNVIRNISDPAGFYHDDGIQFFGNVQNVQITNNVLANSRNQLIFIQDAVKSLTTGSSINKNILIAHNLIYGAGSWAIQSQGALDVRFIGNTMWSNHYGSLLLRRSSYTGLAPHDTVVMGNIIQGFAVDHVRPRYLQHNLFDPVHLLPLTELRARARAARRRRLHDMIDVKPRFVDAAGGDFRLRTWSPAQRKVSVQEFLNLVRGVSDLSVDMYGRPYPVTGRLAIGALQPRDPRIFYGQPLFGPPPLS